MLVDEILLLGSQSPEIYTESNQLTNILHPAIALTRRHLTAEAQVQYWVSADGVCNGPHGTGTGVSSRWQRR
jgi:hypothetical protein